MAFLRVFYSTSYLLVKTFLRESCQQVACWVENVNSTWFPSFGTRTTRSGKEFSAYAGAVPLRAAHPVNIATLIQQACAQQALDLDLDAEDDTVAPPSAPPAAPAPPPTLPIPSATDSPPATQLKRPAADRPEDEPMPKQSRNNWKRRVKKDAAHRLSGHIPSARTVENVVVPAVAVETKLRPEELPVKHGGYAAKNEHLPDARKTWTLEGLIAEGFEVIKWDGCTARPLVDVNGVIYAVLAAKPNDPTYAKATEDAFAAFEEEGAKAEFRPEEKAHRRGNFPALATGISYGNGQGVPAPLKEGTTGMHAPMIQRLVGQAAVVRMAAFASACFALWAPRVYKYYQEHAETMFAALPHLKPNFPKSIFACATLNFGPIVCTFKHRDVLNCPFGWCAIQALGRFDHTKGGHIILWDAKLVIQFPAGSTILIPSATIAHSNLPIARGECRASFTQYTAGGLFRWVDNGCRTETQLAKEDPEEYVRICGLKAGRWSEGLKLFSTLNELSIIDKGSITPGDDECEEFEA